MPDAVPVPGMETMTFKLPCLDDFSNVSYAFFISSKAKSGGEGQLAHANIHL